MRPRKYDAERSLAKNSVVGPAGLEPATNPL